MSISSSVSSQNKSSEQIKAPSRHNLWLVLCFLFILVGFGEVKIIQSHRFKASATRGSNLRGTVQLIQSLMRYPPSPILMSCQSSSLPSLAAVVQACRLPSIQEPHSSQDKQTQSLQLSSAIKGTGYWQIKRGEMKWFFVLLQADNSLKVELVKFCLLFMSLNILISLHVGICA